MPCEVLSTEHVALLLLSHYVALVLLLLHHLSLHLLLVLDGLLLEQGLVAILLHVLLATHGVILLLPMSKYLSRLGKALLASHGLLLEQVLLLQLLLLLLSLAHILLLLVVIVHFDV